MPDWKRYHAAIVAGTPMAELANACETAWPWLDLTADERRQRITESITGEAAARWMLQALNFVRLRLLRDAGIALEDTARFVTIDEALRAGRATADEVAVVRRTSAAREISDAVAALYPAANVALTPDPDAEALAAQTPALTAAIAACGVGRVRAESLAALRAAIDAFDVAGRHWNEKVVREHAWWLSRAWWAVGRSALELGRNDDGRDAIERAEASAARAGDTEFVEDCRQRLSDLALHRTADFDSAAGRELQALLAAQLPLARVQALLRLAHETGMAGDKFEAAELAKEAAKVLSDCGYVDPEAGVDSAIDRWIATASTSCAGSALSAQLAQVTEHWAAILGTRSMRPKGDAQASARAEACLRALGSLTNDFYEQAGHAEQEAALRFAVWSPYTALPEARQSVDESKRITERQLALQDALYALRLACNEGPSEAQLEVAASLVAQAETLGSRFHLASAHLEYAYVLIALQRFAEVPPRTSAAVSALLGNNEARLSAFATGYERELYLTAIQYQTQSLIGQRDFAAVLTLCGPVIADIEDERARVNSPYQQNSFLATRSELYELTAGAAYRTQRWDEFLATTELMKSRSALRNRLTPVLDPDTSRIEAEYREVNEALAGAAGVSADQSELRDRRRWLVTARAIARARAAAVTLPELTVHAVQQTLAADEAAISWFWLGSDATFVMAITRDDVQVKLIRFDEHQLTQHRTYLDCLNTLALGASEDDLKALLPVLEQAIAILGEALLPAEVRAIVSGKAKLVLCPHRSLHLFPLHAAPWRHGESTDFLIEHFAIRYVPNLSSLLVPWHGNQTGPVLAVGVAQFDDLEVRELPDAEAEAREVAGVHGAAGQSLLGATCAQFKQLPLRDYRCLHLATHASSVLTGDAVNDPLESCLHLRDGMLTGWEISTLSLRAELVVLAACHSGQRSIAGRGLDQLPGDDMFGFSATLFESGVLAVLGTLWPVDDETARAILVDFHRAYAAGAAPEIALQSAIIKHLASVDRRREVFDWAPFFISSLGRAQNKSAVTPQLIASQTASCVK